MVHVAEDHCDGRTNGHIGEGSISPSSFPMSVLNHDFSSKEAGLLDSVVEEY